MTWRIGRARGSYAESGGAGLSGRGGETSGGMNAPRARPRAAIFSASKMDAQALRSLFFVLAMLTVAWWVLVLPSPAATPEADASPREGAQPGRGTAAGPRARADGACVHVPKDVYMLWDKGFENAPAWEQTCLWTWQHHNPDWTVHAMNMSVAMERADVFRWIPEDKWPRIGIVAKADILRVLILARYGGVWADSSVACNAPLTGGAIMEWLAARGGDVLQFRRDDIGALRRGESQKHRKPRKRHAPWPHWISSWLIVAPGPGLAAGAAAADGDHRCSYVLWRWREELRAHWAEQDPATNKYFWLNIMESRLAAEDPRFAAAVSADTLPSADPVHCMKTWADGRRLFVNEDGRTVNETVAAAVPLFKRCNMEAIVALYRAGCAPDCFESRGDRERTKQKGRLWEPVDPAERAAAEAAGLRLCLSNGKLGAEACM